MEQKLSYSEMLLGDWQGRLKVRLSELGYDSYASYLRKNPCICYVELAKQLGDFVGIQLMSAHTDVIKQSDDPRLEAIDVFSRFVVRHWNKTKFAEDFRIVCIFCDWKDIVKRALPKNFAVISDRLLPYLKENTPQPNWVPTSLDDPALKRIFDYAWPKGFELLDD